MINMSFRSDDEFISLFSFTDVKTAVFRVIYKTFCCEDVVNINLVGRAKILQTVTFRLILQV